MSNTYYSPMTGRELQATGVEGIYKEDRYAQTYLVSADGNLVRMVSPSSGGILVRNEDGSYSDPYIGENFTFDNSRSAFIPHFIPDETMEPAKIEGDQLVGVESGRRFDIDSNGRILTPEEIAHQRAQASDMARINQMQEDGTINEYLNQVYNRIHEAQKRLERARSTGKLGDQFKSIVDAEEEDIDHILLHFEEIIADISAQDKETIDELLGYFNNMEVIEKGKKLPTYDDPVLAARLNERYKELTGEDHPTFVEHAPEVIRRYMHARPELQKVGGYFSDTYFIELDSVYTYMMENQPDVMKSYQELSHVERLRREHRSFGIEMPEHYYEIEELKDRVEKGKVEPDDLRKLCDISFGKGSALSNAMFDAMILTGRVPANDNVYATVLRRQMDKAYGAGSEEATRAFDTIWSMRSSALRYEQIATQLEKYGVPTVEMIESATKKELVGMRTHIMESDPYLAYREQLRGHYLSEREPGIFIVSQFEMIDGEQPICHHTLESISEEGKKVLMEKSFDYTEEFQRDMLEPALADYAECSPDMRPTVTSHIDEGVEWASSDYRAVSGNNNVLRVNNIPNEYAREIANKVQQTQPVRFEQKEAEQMAFQHEKGGYQMVLTKTGFASILVLALLAGFMCGLGIVLGFYFG